MGFLDIVILLVFILVFILLTSTKMRSNDSWAATVTPLASIIGSGFLVSVPLLASSVGIWSVGAIAILVFLAYLIGGAIRYNIQYGEPLFDNEPSASTIQSIESMSHLVLIGAYFISVAYYLALLATFGLKLFGLDSPLAGQAIASVFLISICMTGAIRGLQSVERVEVYSVSANLSAIAALIAALFIFGFNLPSGYSWEAAASEHHEIDWETFRFLMGLLIVVQGFETTRFMGQLYKPEMRIKAMKKSQITSSLIYIVFFILMIPLYPYFTSTADVAGVIEVVGRVTPWLPFVVTAGAIASQFSASVADSIGASGLISETSHKRITPAHAYILIGAVGLLILWSTDVVAIVTLASRAFALFYSLQCGVATLIAHRRKETARSCWYAFLTAIAGAVALLGIPASG